MSSLPLDSHKHIIDPFTVTASCCDGHLHHYMPIVSTSLWAAGPFTMSPSVPLVGSLTFTFQYPITI